MNKLAILFITAITALSLTSCWGTEIETETANANLNPNANSTVTANVSANEINNPNENTQSVKQTQLTEAQTNKIGNHVRTGEPGVDSKEMKKAEKNRQYIPAPENSLISNEMNNQGQPVQTRKFSGNPTLDKIEVIALGEKERKQLVYLKSGKVLPLEQGKISDPMTASSYDLLKAVGIGAKVPAQSSDEKKKKN